MIEVINEYMTFTKSFISYMFFFQCWCNFTS